MVAKHVAVFLIAVLGSSVVLGGFGSGAAQAQSFSEAFNVFLPQSHSAFEVGIDQAVQELFAAQALAIVALDLETQRALQDELASRFEEAGASADELADQLKELKEGPTGSPAATLPTPQSLPQQEAIQNQVGSAGIQIVSGAFAAGSGGDSRVAVGSAFQDAVTKIASAFSSDAGGAGSSSSSGGGGGGGGGTS